MRLDALVEEFGKGTDNKDKNSRQKKRRAILMLALYLFTGATFCDFILEESLQCYGFGIMSLAMNDDWDILREELPKYQKFHDSCKTIHYVASVINPLTGYYFQFYYDADQRKIDIWQRQIERHDSRFREIVAGETREIHFNGDGTVVISIDTGSIIENIYVPFPEVVTLPREGDLVQCECAKKYIRGSQHLELVRLTT